MLSSLAFIFILALVLGYLSTLLKLPPLVGMLITGIILGSYGFNLIDSSIADISIELRQIALVIILLRAGLSLNVTELRAVGRPAALMCFLPASFEIVGVMILAPMLFGVTLLEAAVMGAVVAAVSPAVMVPKMINLMERKIGTDKGIPQMIMAAGSVDDVFVIVLFTAFSSLAMGGTLSGATLLEIPISILSGLALGVAVGWALSQYFKRFHMRDSIKLLLLLSASFLFLGLESTLKGVVPISGLLAVMAMGASVNMFYPILARRISPKFSKLWVGAEILLFVLVGASVNISYATAAGFAAVALILGAMVVRMLGVYSSLIKTKLNLKERLFCMIAYMPKATVQAAIGSLPLAMGMPCGDLILTVAVLSILITAPLGAFGIDASYKKLLISDK